MDASGQSGGDSTTPSDSTRGGRSVARLVILAIVLAGAICLVSFTPIRSWLSKEHIRASAQSLGFAFYPICVVGVAVLVSCGVPRLLFCALGGAVLGFWPGLLLTQLGTLLGYYSVFAFIRWGGRDWALHRWPRLRKWADLVHQGGVIGVILVRQVPLHGTLTNLALGLSRVKHRHFLLGTAIGLLTEAIPATLIGAGLVEGSLKDMAPYFVLAAVAFGVIWIAGRYWLRGMRAAPADEPMPESAKGVA